MSLPGKMLFVLLAGLLACLLASCAPAQPERSKVHVAVAANFTAAANEIRAAFEQQTGHAVILSYGSTGQLYTQIVHGAPYDIFLAADQAHPARAIADGYAVADSGITYAVGRIVLYSTDPDVALDTDLLVPAQIRTIAIANPDTAPYGAAAVEALRNLGIYAELSGKITQGTNIAQTYQFVQTGNADLGIVALAQMRDVPDTQYRLVPDALFTPIAQDAVMLHAGSDNPAASAFLEFLASAQVDAIISQHGYDRPGRKEG